VGNWAYVFVTVGAIISGFGALNGFILLQGQVPMAAGQDKPRRFATLSTAGVPAFACVVSTILASAMLFANFGGRSGAGALVDVYNSIILIALFTTLVPYAFCAMAELLLAIPRRDQLDDKRRQWITSLIGILAFVFSFVAIIGAVADTALRGFAALLLGVPVYVWLRRHEEPRAESRVVQCVQPVVRTLPLASAVAAR
jgi:APA family basic amino acid/polyamine antiporter